MLAMVGSKSRNPLIRHHSPGVTPQIKNAQLRALWPVASRRVCPGWRNRHPPFDRYVPLQRFPTGNVKCYVEGTLIWSWADEPWAWGDRARRRVNYETGATALGEGNRPPGVCGQVWRPRPLGSVEIDARCGLANLVAGLVAGDGRRARTKPPYRGSNRQCPTCTAPLGEAGSNRTHGLADSRPGPVEPGETCRPQTGLEICRAHQSNADEVGITTGRRAGYARQPRFHQAALRGIHALSRVAPYTGAAAAPATSARAVLNGRGQCHER
jgi:hypothetical protein